MSITVNEASGVPLEAVRNTIRKHSLLYLVQGGVMVVAGIFALLFPLFMAAGFLVLLGWLLVASGLVQALSLVGATKVPYFWLQLVSVGLEVLVGYLRISNPAAGLVAVTYLMVVLFLVGGLAKIVFALMIRPMPDWGWLFGAGMISTIAAGILIGGLPEAATWLLGVLLGIQLVTAGAAQVSLAWSIRSASVAA
jgi:uncharacterized membrane protein HdeD (DUF308 family)